MSSPRFIAAFITGHSVPGCTGLSQEQRDFQQRTSIPADQWLPHNFPYHATFPFPEPFNLLRASVNNVLHYSRSRRAAFRQSHRDAVSQALEPYDTILLLAGSCGLELFNNLDLPPALRQRIHIFAYGPVSRRPPDVASHLFVQGTHDWLSRFYHPRVHNRYPCPHMGYLLSPQTLRFFKAYHHRVNPAAP